MYPGILANRNLWTKE